MENDNGQNVEKDNETLISTQVRTPGGSLSTGRPNIDDINKRNAEEEKQDRKSTYTTTGIIVLLVVVIIVAIYFFS